MIRIQPDNIEFILVEPKHPGNIGAAARAIKTMGFENMTLVNPCDFRVPEVSYMAHASSDILDKIKVVNTLAEAITAQHFVVATTQRKRIYQMPFYTPQELGEKVIPMSQQHKVAIVFGRERTGLTNEELQICTAVSTIPAAVEHPSLNLSQAVMIYGYELFKGSYESTRRFKWEMAENDQVEQVYAHLERSLRRTDFVPLDSWDRFMMRFRRFFSRATPEMRDVNLMHKILQAFEYRMDRLENPDESKGKRNL